MNNTATLLALLVTERNVYIGGTNLNTVNGAARPNLAEIDRYTGEVTDWNPSPDGVVYSLEVNRAFADNIPTLYVGGTFDTIGNPARSRNRAAEVNLTDTGSVTDWDPSPGNGGLGTGTVRAFVPASDQSWACGPGNCASLLGRKLLRAPDLESADRHARARRRGEPRNRATERVVAAIRRRPHGLRPGVVVPRGSRQLHRPDRVLRRADRVDVAAPCNCAAPPRAVLQ